MIAGVKVKEIVTHRDDRGFFRDRIRATDEFSGEGFGQWSHSIIHPRAAEAWHIHQSRVDWWDVSAGVLKVAPRDMRRDSPTFGETMELRMGDNQPSRVLRIPDQRGARLQMLERACAPVLHHLPGLRPGGRGSNPARRTVDQLRLVGGAGDQVRPSCTI